MPGIDQYAKLVLHCDGTTGSSLFPDSSTSPHTTTAVGSVQVTTAEFEFPTGSMSLPGSTSYVSVAASTQWTLSGDFTIDCWIKSTQASTTSQEISASFQSTAPFEGWLFGIGFGASSGRLAFFGANSTASTTVTASTPVNTGNWTHVAVSRSSNSLYFFVNGVLDTSATFTQQISGSSNELRVGADTNAAVSRPFLGNIDEFRLSNGIARWTASFTPFQQPYDTYTGFQLSPEFEGTNPVHDRTITVKSY